MQTAQAFVPEYFGLHDPYYAPEDTQNYAAGFSRGSSFQDYQYLLDRGELPSRLCAQDPTLDATGLGFAGNGSSVFADYQQQEQHWEWCSNPDNGEIIAPAPMYAAAQVAPHTTPSSVSDYFGINVTGAFKRPTENLAGLNQETSPVRSPAAQLPTPAAMAILLNPNARSEGEHLTSQESGYGISRGPPGLPILGVVTHLPHPLSLSSHGSSSAPSSGAPRANKRLAEPRNGVMSATLEGQAAIPESSTSREKKHACTMCHKRFDRPSTLRKHLLVHTGEKAHVCETCGRRFGVQSNLNRHVKRCILKPVNSPSSNSPVQSNSATPTITAASSTTITKTTSASISISPTMSPRSPSKRTRISVEVPSHSEGPSLPSSPTTSTTSTMVSPSTSATSSNDARQKRKRRAPSPSQWVPPTLRNFNLLSEDSYRVTSVPLPPVRRHMPKEERDSWDENIGVAPYHPCGWTGVLPGPGLGGGFGAGLGVRDVRNFRDGNGKGGWVLGRIPVF